VRDTKSAELTSVSSPFPAVSSLPPVPIEVLSEVDDALRSMLWLAVGSGAAGDGNGSPSRSVADPIPTLSTSVLVLSYNNTVLSDATESGPVYV